MNNDLISRSALLNQRPEYLNPDHVDIEKALFAKGWNACNSEYYSLITDAAALEAEPVRHGRWESECEPNYKCSCCEHYFHLYQPMNYCPNCGVKMDAEVEQLKAVDVNSYFECAHCKHEELCNSPVWPCNDCDNEECPCYTCSDGSNWRWRGVQEVE